MIYQLPDMPPWGPQGAVGRPIVLLMGSDSAWQQGAATALLRSAPTVLRSDTVGLSGPSRVGVLNEVIRTADVVMVWVDDQDSQDWLELAQLILRPAIGATTWGAAKLDHDPEWHHGGHLRYLVVQAGGVVHPTLEQTLAATSETACRMRQGGQQ